MFMDRGTLRYRLFSRKHSQGSNIIGIDALVNDSLVGMSESPVGDTDVI